MDESPPSTFFAERQASPGRRQVILNSKPTGSAAPVDAFVIWQLVIDVEYRERTSCLFASGIHRFCNRMKYVLRCTCRVPEVGDTHGWHILTPRPVARNESREYPEHWDWLEVWCLSGKAA
jgi:hypothetical protein